MKLPNAKCVVSPIIGKMHILSIAVALVIAVGTGCVEKSVPISDSNDGGAEGNDGDSSETANSSGNTGEGVNTNGSPNPSPPGCTTDDDCPGDWVCLEPTCYDPLDDEPPVVQITSPTTGGSFSTTADHVDVAGTASDNVAVAGVQYRVDGSEWSMCSGAENWFCPSIPLNMGSQQIEVRAFDAGGNGGVAGLSVTREEGQSDGSTTDGDGSTSDGNGSTSSGDGSTSDGNGSTSDGDGSTSDGDGSSSSGSGSTSDDDGSSSSGSGSTSDGNGSTSSGNGATSDGNQPPPDQEVPSDFSDVIWLHHDVSGWEETATLSSVHFGAGSTICMDYDKADVWEGVNTVGAYVNANPWIFIQRDGQWYAATWEWMRVGQTCKNQSAVAGDHIKREPFESEDWTPEPGEWYGFMLSGLARSPARNHEERSNVVMFQWPED